MIKSRANCYEIPTRSEDPRAYRVVKILTETKAPAVTSPTWGLLRRAVGAVALTLATFGVAGAMEDCHISAHEQLHQLDVTERWYPGQLLLWSVHVNSGPHSGASFYYYSDSSDRDEIFQGFVLTLCEPGEPFKDEEPIIETVPQDDYGCAYCGPAAGLTNGGAK